MNLDALESFAKIAEVRSLSAAAKLHGLPKSSLSLKLRQLEADLGVPLFVREGRRLELTDAGTELLKHARQIVAACESARAAVSEAHEEIAGTLRIGSTGEFGTAFNAQMLYAFRQRYPLVKLELVFFAPDVLFSAESLQSFDVILSWDEPGEDGHRWETLSTATYGLFASRAYLERVGTPTSPADFGGHHGVLYRLPAGVQSWRLQKNGETAELLPTSSFITNDYWTVKYFAVAGEGVAYLPKFFARIECERGDLVPVLPDWESEEKRIEIRPTRPNLASRKTTAFVECCKTYFSAGFEFQGPRYYVETVLGTNNNPEGTTS